MLAQAWKKLLKLRPSAANRLDVTLAQDFEMPNDVKRGGHLLVVDRWKFRPEDHMRLEEIEQSDFVTVEGPCEVCGDDFDDLLVVLGANKTTSIEKALCRTCLRISYRKLPGENWRKSFFSEVFYNDELRWRDLPKSNPAIYDFVKDYLPKQGAIFDVGCGFGEMLEPFKKAGYSVVGIEASGHRAQYAKKRLGDAVYHLTVEEALNDDRVRDHGPYALCAFFAVLEFIREPLVVLRELRDLIEDDGLLFVSVRTFTQRSLWQDAHMGFISESYTAHSLPLLLRRVGFETVATSGGEKGNFHVLARKTREYDSEEVASLVDDEKQHVALDSIASHVVQETGMREFQVGVYAVNQRWAHGREVRLHGTALPEVNELSDIDLMKKVSPIVYYYPDGAPRVIVK